MFPPLIEQISWAACSRGLLTQLRREGFDLAPGLFKGAGAINFFSGETQLFLDGELGIDAASGFCFA